jgi:hypothetical protein
VGEIILVVIGILIALQVNNLNIDRQNNKAERTYLLRMIQDLESDIEEAGKMLDRHNYLEVRGVYVLEKLGSDTEKIVSNFIYQDIRPSFIDSIRNQPNPFGQKLGSVRIYLLFDVNDDTFQELISSGKLDLIKSEEIRKAISRHYRILEDKMQLQYLKEVERNRYVEILAQNGISSANTDDFPEVMRKIKNKNQIIIQIENMIYIHRPALVATTIGDGSILKMSEELIQRIEEYLE